MTMSKSRKRKPPNLAGGELDQIQFAPGDFPVLIRAIAVEPMTRHAQSCATSQELMVYRNETKPLQIIRVLHGARDVSEHRWPGHPKNVAEAITATQSRLPRHTSTYR